MARTPADDSRARRPDRLVRGIGLVLLLTIAAFLGSIILLPPALVLIIIPLGLARDAFRIYASTYGAMWFGFAAGLLEHVGDTKVRVFGDPLVYGERVIIISNHRTRIDWMFLWCFTARYGFLRSLRVLLKSSLKAVPFFGWAMQSFLFLFIDRGSQNRDKDLAHIRRICTYLSLDRRAPNTLILFPEGTDLSESNLEKDRKFASEKGLTAYTQVLHPRSLAFATATSTLAGHGHLDAIYDITLAYVDYQPGERPCEVSVLKGRMPQEIHMHVKRHDVHSMSTQAEELEKLLQRSFDEKEQVLSYFYKDQRHAFPPHLLTEPPAPSPSAHAAALLQPEHLALAAFRLSCLGWMLVLVLTCLVAWRYPLRFWLYALLSACFLHAVTVVAGGLDNLELRLAATDQSETTARSKRD